MARQVSSGPYLITTAPSIFKCSQCRRLVLAATVNGFDRHVDPTALNDLGELAALLAGRDTYELHTERLVPRSADRIGAAPRTGCPVMAEHSCDEGVVSRAHTDPIVMDRAVALVQVLLGAETVLPTDPPF